MALIQQTHLTENRALKVLGGIKGIANSCQALSEYFLSAAEMGSIVGNFCETFGIEGNQSRKRDEHHQLFGSKNKRIYSNTEKILRVFQTHNVTKIGHLETKQFLSSINTKNEYVSKRTAHQLEKDYVIVYGKSCLTNLPDLDQELRTNYIHKEADTGIVLHALDVSKRDQCSELVISCSDTDVLLILLHYFDNLTSSTIFKTTEH